MIKIEPNNPRWYYFLFRDGGLDLIDHMEIENKIRELILKDKTQALEEDNILFHEFTFGLLDMLLILKFTRRNYDEVYEITDLLNRLIPNNSNSIYYSTLSKIMQYKENMSNLLQQTIEYRENNFDIQHGMLHSHGYHVDFLIGVLLFETGMYNKASKYFNFTEGKFTDDTIMSIYQPFLEAYKNYNNINNR